MYLLYTLLISIWLIVMAPVLWYRAVFKKKALPGIGERFGKLPATLANDGRRTIWLHACSVGETISIQPLASELTRRYSDTRLVFSTITQGGQKVARESFAKYGEGNVFYFPVDLPHIAKHVFDTIRPDMLIIVDTEIWPNVLREAHSRNIPVILVNGRISDRSFRSYRWLSAVMGPVLANYRLLLMKDDIDAQRIRHMGAPSSRVRVSGNMKYDLTPKDITGEQKAALSAALGIGDSQGPLIVAGSTHEGEEDALFVALSELRSAPATANVRLILAPRHIERTDSVVAQAERRGFTVTRRSANAPVAGAQVLLIDTLGELATAYQFADIAFVGGTLVPIGGHSIMEPALYGKPIVVGPHLENFGNTVKEFREVGAIEQLSSPDGDIEAQGRDLAAAFTALLTDDQRRAAMGFAAQAMFEKSRGATALTADCIADILDSQAAQKM